MERNIVGGANLSSLTKEMVYRFPDNDLIKTEVLKLDAMEPK